jgi:hypothetical protein
MLLGLAVLWLWASRRAGELEMKATLPAAAFIQGRPIELTVAVTNRSENPIRLNTWSPFDREDCRVLEGQPVVLQLFDEPLHRPTLEVPYGLEGEVPRGELAAGETMELVCDVGQLFGLIQTRRHSLEVSYVRDPWARRSALALPARLWGSLLGPETLTFEVVPLYR